MVWAGRSYTVKVGHSSNGASWYLRAPPEARRPIPPMTGNHVSKYLVSGGASPATRIVAGPGRRPAGFGYLSAAVAVVQDPTTELRN